eukprot:gene11746-13706_t
MDSLSFNQKIRSKNFKNTIPITGIIVPATALAYGFVKLNNSALTKLDEKARQEFYAQHPHRKFTIDDYLQFAPGAAVFTLNAMGIKGKNSLTDQGGVYLVSNIILNATCQSLKRITAVTRPNGAPNSFPSGHAAEAFASAEFLRQEYNEISPCDVISGAGLGILSTQTSYWLYPKIKNLFSDRSKNNTIILPSYNHGAMGAGMVKKF